MNIQIARKLHERRFAGSPLLTTGELINLIGPDNLQEALNRRWLVPDMDSGFLSLNLHGGKLMELESACRCPACGKPACTCLPPTASESTQMPAAIRETFAGPALARPEDRAATGVSGAPVLPRPATSTPTQPETKPVRVGDPAMVSHEGSTYQGEVGSIEPDGRVRLRWKGQRPPEDRPYAPTEFLRVDPVK